MQSFDLNDIRWQEASADDTRYALLEGDKQTYGVMGVECLELAAAVVLTVIVDRLQTV